MRNQQSGFTLIELVMVIVILGILAATAMPKYVDMKTDAQNAAKKGFVGAVKSARAIYLAQSKGVNPTVQQLADATEDGTADVTGVQFDMDGTAVTVLTFSKADCTTATTALTDSVLCVKGTNP